ncbi:MAG: citrate lyase holo-[acyl-carrier protein] synthase [Propionibacteriaceae bacterium]
MISVAEVVARRDARQARQRELLDERDMPLVSFTVVAPGPVKDSDLIQRVFAEGKAEVLALIRDVELWPIWDVESYDGVTGPELLLSVDAYSSDLKQALIRLEDEHPWGRLWDIDVITEHGPLARTSFGAPQRRCLLCERPSPECARSRRHSVEELVQRQRDIVTAGLGDGPTIAELAVRALLQEAELTPKPGLVDQDNSGAHDDMTITTFRRSAEALAEFFAQAEIIGPRLPELRAAGITAEDTMREATGGVNTHQGAIYSLGLLVATQGDVAQAAALAAQTVGEPTRVTGQGGARAEAAAGFPHALIGLEEYRRSGSWHRALVAIMAHNDDSNLVARGGTDALHGVQAWSRELLAVELNQEQFIAELRAADAHFSQRRWSPGGSADLLAVAMLLAEIAG